MQERLAHSCHQLSTLVAELAKTQGETLIRAGHKLAEIFTRGGQLILAGDGPLQTAVQSTAVAFSHRLGFERPPLPAIALGGDPILTAALLADQQPHEILAREYRTYNEREHMLLLFCTATPSVQIRHLIEQLDETRTLVMAVPENSPLDLGQQPALKLSLPECPPARYLEITQFCGHLLCELVESELFGV